MNHNKQLIELKLALLPIYSVFIAGTKGEGNRFIIDREVISLLGFEFHNFKINIFLKKEKQIEKELTI